MIDIQEPTAEEIKNTALELRERKIDFELTQVFLWGESFYKESKRTDQCHKARLVKARERFLASVVNAVLYHLPGGPITEEELKKSRMYLIRKRQKAAQLKGLE